MSNVILIVEDDPKSLKLIRDLLRASGYAIIEATDGRQGVEQARAQKPDLIFMDIQMPVVNGIEATKILKTDRATKDIPIIALTASAMKEDKVKAFQAGCDGYITKPIDIKRFLKKAKEYLSGHIDRTVNER